MDRGNLETAASDELRAASQTYITPYQKYPKINNSSSQLKARSL
jgi:hypothetical protein